MGVVAGHASSRRKHAQMASMYAFCDSDPVCACQFHFISTPRSQWISPISEISNLEWRSDLQLERRDGESEAKVRSSTAITMMMMQPSILLWNTHCSTLQHMYPNLVNASQMHKYQHLPPCFRPYRAFDSLQTFMCWPALTKPGSWA